MPEYGVTLIPTASQLVPKDWNDFYLLATSRERRSTPISIF
jgi:hypothetical protein